jgi:tetratricopeptide (TPR) repeat protein
VRQWSSAISIADYTEAIRIDPKFVWAYLNRGDARIKNNEYDEGIADYSEAIRIDPHFDWAYLHRGTARTNRQEYDKAIADFDEAIRVNPGSHAAYNARALVWTSCPDENDCAGNKAIGSATKACELTKWNNASYLETLAAACASVEDFESAVKWQAKANALYSDEEEKARGEDRLRLYQEQKKLCDVAGAR